MKIAVLTSGGVDSSVALKLLQEQGHEVTAFYLKIWLEDEISYLGSCPWHEDLEYVQRICDESGIPLEVMPMQKEYFDSVVKYMVKEIRDGRTPNPDVMCNNNIKFGLFLEKIDSSYEKVATGHYAGVIEQKGRYFLKKNPDRIKDQTYFLANLKQSQLKKLIFPLAELTKVEVRNLAKKFDLPNKDRRDSQGICFLGKLKYNEFVQHYLGKKMGKLVEFDTGRDLGEHDGSWFYTLGQRKGIRLSGGPYYVVKKDTQKNTVYVSRHYHDADKTRNSFFGVHANWFSDTPPLDEKNLQVKLRHSDYFYECKIEKRNIDEYFVQLEQNDQGIAPGQFAVFYAGDLCLGSLVIT